MNESTKSQKVSPDNADRSFPSILKIPYSNTNKRMNCISWKERERERESNGHDEGRRRGTVRTPKTDRETPPKEEEGGRFQNQNGKNSRIRGGLLLLI